MSPTFGPSRSTASPSRAEPAEDASDRRVLTRLADELITLGLDVGWLKNDARGGGLVPALEVRHQSRRIMVLTSMTGLDYITGAGRRIGTTTDPRDAARILHALIDQFKLPGSSGDAYLGEPLNDVRLRRRCWSRRDATRVRGLPDGDVDNGRR